MKIKSIVILSFLLPTLFACGGSKSATSASQKTWKTKADLIQDLFTYEKATKIGEENKGAFSVTVNWAKKTKRLSSRKSTENLYLVLEATMTSHVKEETLLLSGDFELWSRNLVAYTPTSDSIYLNLDNIFVISESFNYEITKTITFVFEVPETPNEWIFAFTFKNVVYGNNIGNSADMEELFK